jgi:hypothetical protein
VKALAYGPTVVVRAGSQFDGGAAVTDSSDAAWRDFDVKVHAA